jgi:uncharacterized membrane protein
MLINHKDTLYAFVAILAIHLFFSAIIPPFQSPDEFHHLQRAYLLSKGEIAMETPEGESTGGRIDTGLNTYMGMHNEFAGNPDNKITAEDRAAVKLVQWSDERRFGAAPGVNYYFPMIYSPQALGLFIGQQMGLTVETSYFLARFSAAIFIAAILLLAFNIFRPSLFIISLLIIPMTIFQFASTSQDGVATALVILVASIFLRLTTSPDPISKKYFYLMAFSVLLITTSRINLLPILGLLFIAAHYSKERRIYYSLASIVTLLSLLWVLYALLTTVDNRLVLEHSTAEVILHYVKNPFDFFSVLGHTLSDDKLTGFYLASFFGVLGWLDTNIGGQNVSILLYSTLFIFLLSISLPTLKKERKARAALFITGIFSILLLFFLLLITWSKHPADVINGVQGRYFLAPVLLIGYSLTTSHKNLSRLQAIAGMTGLLTIAALTSFAIPRVLIDRYYVMPNHDSCALCPSLEAPVERQLTVKSNPDASAVDIGGYVDALEISDQQLLISGWAFFSNEDHKFSSNYSTDIESLHLPQKRLDVAKALSDSRLTYAGFRLTIDINRSPVNLDNLCLYSEDVIFGRKLIQRGSSDVAYKCDAGD